MAKRSKAAENVADFCDSLVGSFVRAHAPNDDGETDGYWFVPPSAAGEACVPEPIGGSRFADRIMQFDPDIPPIKKELAPYRSEALKRARHGVRAEICDFAAQAGNGLIVHLGRGVAVRIDGAGMSPVPQLVGLPTGQRLLFVDLPKFAPIPLADSLAIWTGAADFAFSGFRMAFLSHLPPDQRDLMTADEQAALILAWWIGIFIGPMVQGRPILALTGIYGSGKSMTGRLLGTAFAGPDYEVSGGISGDRAMKDVASALVERPMVIRDDMNQVPDEMTDLLCRVATGATLELSAFHETLARVEYEMRAALAITSIRPRWALREDLLSRLLALRFGKPAPSSMTESERIEIIAKARTYVWTETLKALAGGFSVGDTLDSQIGSLITRFQDWERIVRRVALIGGWLIPFDSALRKLPEQTMNLAAMTDPTLAALKALAETPGVGDREYTAAELYDAMSFMMGGQISDDPNNRPSQSIVRNARAMGQFLNNLEKVGGAVCIIERAGKSHNAIRWRIRPKTKM